MVEGVIFALDAGVVVSGSNVWAFVEFWWYVELKKGMEFFDKLFFF